MLPCSFTLLGTGFEGTSPTLLLTTHKRPRYGAFSSADAPPVESLFFNCGECACRIAGEARLKLGRTTAVALTRAAPGHVAGLPSLIFHLARTAVAARCCACLAAAARAARTCARWARL